MCSPAALVAIHAEFSHTAVYNRLTVRKNRHNLTVSNTLVQNLFILTIWDILHNIYKIGYRISVRKP